MSAPEFLGRAGTAGACACCGRRIVVAYALRVDGVEVVYGRRCAARAMGWATSRVEMQAIRAERMAEVARRREVMFVEVPALREIWDARTRTGAGLADHRTSLIITASGEDAWWGGKGWAAYPSWQAYLAEFLPEVVA